MTEPSTRSGKVSRGDAWRLATATILAPTIAWATGFAAVNAAFYPDDLSYLRHADVELDLKLRVLARMVTELVHPGVTIALPLNLIVGTPTYLFFKRRGLVGLRHAVVGGLAPALAMILILVLFWSLDQLLARAPDWSALGFLVFLTSVLGAATGAIFWLIRRPDRDEPPAHMPQSPTA